MSRNMELIRASIVEVGEVHAIAALDPPYSLSFQFSRRELYRDRSSWLAVTLGSIVWVGIRNGEPHGVSTIEPRDTD